IYPECRSSSLWALTIQSVGRGAPAGLLGPWPPCAPAVPAGPAKPAGPGGPVSPFAPCGPAGPESPLGPGAPWPQLATITETAMTPMKTTGRMADLFADVIPRCLNLQSPA